MIALDRLTVTVPRRTAVDGHVADSSSPNLRGPIKPDRLGELFHRLVREADLPVGCQNSSQG
jgi:hypothetical protein